MAIFRNQPKASDFINNVYTVPTGIWQGLKAWRKGNGAKANLIYDKGTLWWIGYHVQKDRKARTWTITEYAFVSKEVHTFKQLKDHFVVVLK